MLGTDARRRNRLEELRRFLTRFCPTLDKTRQRFFRQSVFGILQSRSLVVARWVRCIRDRCRCPFYAQKRLLNQVKSADWDHRKVLAAYQKRWAERIEVDTPIIIDLCDLAKPRAKRMKYLALVRDGSEDKLVNGYWCLEVYAYLGKRSIVPLLLDPYGIDDPETIGENARILRGVWRVMEATAGRGVLVMDRGADRVNLLVPWVDDDRRFVVRMRGDRHLLLPNGTRVDAALLADRLLNEGRGRRRVAWQQVFLPERPNDPLWLVCKILPGRDRPLIVLTSLRVEGLVAARDVLSYYRRRWKCEEAARFGKGALGMEKFCLRTYEAFGRLMLLLMVAMGFLTWLALRQPELARWLADNHPGQHKIKFAYYRLLDWLTRQIHPPIVRIMTT
jgi:hypothetical protein